jgi:DNA uptake protein ComE-like DNA-binding protein
MNTLHRVCLRETPARRPPRRRARRGTIFVVVLWIALGLVSLALYFAQTARWAYLSSHNSLTSHQADQAIEGVRQYITYVLAEVVEAGKPPSITNADYIAEAIPIGDSRAWILGRDVHTDVPPDTPQWGLVDEASKLNINVATLEMLEKLPNMTTALAAALIDWRDADSELTSEGAESQYYETLKSPYSAKNGLFESVEELRLVRGFDLALLWGEDANGNGALDLNENDGDKNPPADNANGRLDPGLMEYVTVWTREPNTRPDGSARINLTGTSARQQLRQLFEETFGSGRATELLQRLEPALRSRAVDSPIALYLLGGMNAEEFAKIEYAVTVSEGSYRVGLVNVATASATVLACLPGMDTSKAEALVAKRRGLDDTTLESTAWVTTVLEESVARQIGPWITARSYQYSADIVAVGENGRGLRRSFLVFDRESTTEPKLIYRRDRARLGWPLGTTLRDTLRNANKS